MNPRIRSAFSLLELLVVMGIIAILATLAISAMGGISAGRNLATGGNLLLDQLSLARQTALTRNARVRWQIFSVADERNGDPAAVRRMQLEYFDPSARTWKMLGRRETLPITIIADPDRSTLLKNGATSGTVTFLANGRTGLDPNAIHSLTLFDGRSASNFITIQLDPISGRCRTFQP